MSWADCQEYMRVIHELRAELSRELDAVQLNKEPRILTFQALDKLRRARKKYWDSILSEERY